ncbi:MAG TPA: lysophospholipid acyltransferase family protein [Chloroflexota bacterium]
MAVGRRSIRLTTRLTLAALNAASVVTGVVPRDRLAEPICRLAGAAWYLSSAVAREAVHDNLRHVLGRAPTRAEVVRVFHHGALNYWDTFATQHFSRQQIIDLVDMTGLDHIDAALLAGRGVICATAHIGSVSFVGQILPALGYPLVSLLEPLQPPEIYEFFARQRQTFGSRLFPVSTSGLREILQALHRNQVVGLVSDRDITGTGPFIPFFGTPTRFPDGAAALSLRTGAPILIAVTARKAGGRFDAWIEPLRPPPPAGDARQDVVRLTQAVAQRLEYYVANHPEQWTVFQKRWPPEHPAHETYG